MVIKKKEYLNPVEVLADNGFLRHTCCGCGMIHTFHLSKRAEGIVISHVREEELEQLRRYYENNHRNKK